jgi:hypothetical protein
MVEIILKKLSAYKKKEKCLPVTRCMTLENIRQQWK